jgi:hypothetical protein
VEVNRIPLPKKHEIEKRVPGISSDLILSLIDYLNSIIEQRTAPLYIFFNPDLEFHARKIGAEPKYVYLSLNFLSSFFGDQIKHTIIFDQDGLFYQLQEEDLKELKERNRLHNPEDPRIVYERAQDLVRHAFVVGSDY